MTTQLKVLYALVIVSILLSLVGVLQTFRNRPVAPVPGQKSALHLNAKQSKADWRSGDWGNYDLQCASQCQNTEEACIQSSLHQCTGDPNEYQNDFGMCYDESCVTALQGCWDGCLITPPIDPPPPPDDRQPLEIY